MMPILPFVVVLIAGRLTEGGQVPDRWKLVEQARVSADSRAVTLSGVWDVAVSAQADAFVLDGDEPFVKVINRSGQSVRAFGRTGAGPGEFRQPRRIGWLHDTLIVTDVGLKRITLFSRSGRVLRTIQPDLRLPPPFVVSSILGMRPDGTIIVAVADGLLNDDRLSALSNPLQAGLLAFSPSGQLVRSLLLSQRNHRAMILRILLNGVGGQFHMPQPFQDDPLVVLARDGSSVVQVDRAVRIAAQPTFRVTQVTTQGDTIFSRLMPFVPQPLTEDVFRATIEKVRRTPIPGGVRMDMEESELRRLTYRPRMLPPVDDVIVARDGRIWLRREWLGGNRPVDYLVLGVDGVPLGIVSVAATERIIEADGLRVWTIPRDPVEDPALVIYRLSSAK